ncbi:MAG: hypothetical protein V4794_21985 [Pseudomonadota bacterium]
MNEVEFIEAIDCRFPYGDQARARELIELGARISPNASFMVLHEICRPPEGAKEDSLVLLELASSWEGIFEHPLVFVVLPIARSMIQDKLIPVGVAMAAMREVAFYKDQYNALAIPYLACDDKKGEADALHREITHAWQSA